VFGEVAKYVSDYDTKVKVEYFVTMYNVSMNLSRPILSPNLVKQTRECI